MADEDDKENQDANTPPGTVRPPQSDAMDTGLTDDAVAPLAQLREGLVGQSGGHDSDRASCASDMNDAERVRTGAPSDVSSVVVCLQYHCVFSGHVSSVVMRPQWSCVLNTTVSSAHMLLQVDDLPDPRAEATCSSPPPPETDPPAPSSPIYTNGFRPFDMFAHQQADEGAEEESAGPFVVKLASPMGDVRFWSSVPDKPAPFFALDWTTARFFGVGDACVLVHVSSILLYLCYVCNQPHMHLNAAILHSPPLQAGEDEYDLAAMSEPDKHPSVAAAEAESTNPRDVTLDQCLEAFTTAEQLDAADSWYCSKCKDHVRANKKLDLWTLPEVLVVHLKRFSCSRMWRDKLDCAVEFPLEGLDLSRYLLQQQVVVVTGAPEKKSTPSTQADAPAPLYDLYAVSNHYGGLGGGHYTAYCRMPDNGKWYCFDDSHVSEIDADSVRSPAAYVLFYRRRDQHIKEQGAN